MTKRDYIRFAKVIRASKTKNYDLASARFFEREIADIFAHDSPRFNREKFYHACEPKKDK